MQLCKDWDNIIVYNTFQRIRINVDKVLDSAGVRVVRVKAKKAYTLVEVEKLVMRTGEPDKVKRKDGASRYTASIPMNYSKIEDMSEVGIPLFFF